MEVPGDRRVHLSGKHLGRELGDAQAGDECAGRRDSWRWAGFRDDSLDARRERIAADIERLEASPLASRLIDLPRLKRLLGEWPRDAQAAERRAPEYRLALARGVHVGRFVRWVEGANL